MLIGRCWIGFDPSDDCDAHHIRENAWIDAGLADGYHDYDCGSDWIFNGHTISIWAALGYRKRVCCIYSLVLGSQWGCFGSICNPGSYAGALVWVFMGAANWGGSLFVGMAYGELGKSTGSEASPPPVRGTNDTPPKL